MVEGLILAACVGCVSAALVLPLAVCEIVRLGRINRRLTERNAAQGTALAMLAERGHRAVQVIDDSGREGGWIVASADGLRFRMWETGWPRWTDDRQLATRYARREDAEAVHSEDEDAWRVEPFAQKLAIVR